MKTARAQKAPKPDQWLQDHPDRLLSSDQTAQFLGYSVTRLRQLRSSNQGPPWIVLPNGYSIRYRLADVKKWAGLKVTA